MLEGDGVLMLGADETEHAVRTGSLVCRPAGSAIPHAFRAGDDGMTLLMYSDVDTNDMCFYPRRAEVRIPGLGVSFRP